MELPLILINFKLYESAVGKNALKLAKIVEQAAKETGVNMAIAVNHLDVLRVNDAVDIPVFAQHIDPVSFGSRTGHVSPSVLSAEGVYGTLLNHAEKPVSDEHLMDCIYTAKKAGLFTVVCKYSRKRGEYI